MSLSSRIADFVEQFKAWMEKAPTLDIYNLQLQSNNWSYRLSNICYELQRNPVPIGELGLLKVLVPAFKEIYGKSSKGPIDVKYMKQVVDSYEGESTTPVPAFFQLPESQSVPTPAPTPTPTPASAPGPTLTPTPAPRPPAAAIATPAPPPAPPASSSSPSFKRKANKEVPDDADELNHPAKKAKKPRSKSSRAPSVKPESRPRARAKKSAAFIAEDDDLDQQPAAALPTIKLPRRNSKSPAATSSATRPSTVKSGKDGERQYKVNDPPCDRCPANGEECRTYGKNKGCYYCMKKAKRRCSLVSLLTVKGRGKVVDLDEASGAETIVEISDDSNTEDEAAVSENGAAITDNEAVVPPLKGDMRSRDPPMDVDIPDHDMNIVQPANNSDIAMTIRPAPPHQYPIPPAIQGPAVPSAVAHVIPTLATLQSYMERIENLVTRCMTESKSMGEELRGEIRRMESWTFNRMLSMWDDMAKMNHHSIHDLLDKLQSNHRSIHDMLEKLQLLMDKFDPAGIASQLPPAAAQPLPASLQLPPAPQHSPAQEGQSEDTLKQDGPSGQRSRNQSEARPNASVLTPPPLPVNAPASNPNLQEGDEVTSADISMREIVNVDMCLQEGVVQEVSAEKQ